MRRSFDNILSGIHFNFLDLSGKKEEGSCFFFFFQRPFLLLFSEKKIKRKRKRLAVIVLATIWIVSTEPSFNDNVKRKNIKKISFWSMEIHYNSNTNKIDEIYILLFYIQIHR